MLLVLALAAALAVAEPPSDAGDDLPREDPARAQVDPRLTPAFGACLDAPGGESTYGMIQCIAAERDIQDQRLNAAYREAMAGLNARQKARLQAAERAWIAYRDAECASYQDEDWGTLSRITANHCVLDMTVQRLIALENYPPE